MPPNVRSDAPLARRYRIRGRVQNVGFRYYTREQARRLGLVGWVRNLSDGTVEAVAQGTQSELETFRALLDRGPVSARVEKVEETAEIPGPATEFSILG